MVYGYVCVRVSLMHLNCLSDCEKIWYRDRLDLWEEDRLI